MAHEWIYLQYRWALNFSAPSLKRTDGVLHYNGLAPPGGYNSQTLKKTKAPKHFQVDGIKRGRKQKQLIEVCTIIIKRRESGLNNRWFFLKTRPYDSEEAEKFAKCVTDAQQGTLIR